jgi:DNA-binding winged helix-turn-helix (wHTH) protein/TolB-like protein/lipopolysaccharide biosynthesis regulator YciM
MSAEINGLREFGRFRLEAKKKVLWFEGEPVNLPLKEIELLCVLTEKSGEVVTKEELLNRVWTDSFVEESNLSRHIYRLRKTFEELGESAELIQTVPRRGYRFTGEIRQSGDELVIERHLLTSTLVEEVEVSAAPNAGILTAPAQNYSSRLNRLRLFALVSAVILATAFGLYFYNRADDRKSAAPAVKSLAVLPLKSFAASGEDEELRLRITDALITKFGKLKEVSVRPTNSVIPFLNSEADAVQIGKTLGVETILDGRLQSEGEKLRVTLQLVSVKNGVQLWAEQFDGKADEILELQDRISSSVLPKLTDIKSATFGKNPTQNQAAFELYLKGRYVWNKRTPEGYWKALDFFQKAIREDQGFAAAFAGIADCYILLNQRFVLSAEEAFPKAEEAARKALGLDENLAEAHNSLATIYHLYHYDWSNAENHYRKAIELDPNSAPIRGWYGMFLHTFGRFDEAYEILEKAEELDPTSRNISIYLGLNFYFSRKYDLALEQFRKTLELDQTVLTSYQFISHIYELQGNYDKAVEIELERLKIARPKAVETLRAAYEQEGIKGFWRKQIEILNEESEKQPGAEYIIANRYALLGDTENALAYVEKYAPERGSMWTFLKVDPLWESLRDHLRFRKILRKMNLPE